MSSTSSDELAGLAFSETMRGPFALGESDCARGAATGRRAHTTLTFRVDVNIEDMAAFARDPSHAARLGGSVEFEALGTMEAMSGVVRLFAPADAQAGSHARVMYYGLRLAHQDGERFLAGVKHVEGRSLFAMWPETTTLYTRLHDGSDESAPVIGAGVLHLSPLSLLRTLPSMRPTPVVGRARGAATLARFGRFFAGQLWSSYVVRRPATTGYGADERRI